MRIVRLAVTTAAVLALSAAVPGATAATPDPHSCTMQAAGEVVPANPGNIVATAAVVNVDATVECTLDPLRTTVTDMVNGYGGDMSLGVYTDTGVQLCGAPLAVYRSTGPVLVMVQHLECVLGVDQALRTRPLYGRVDWATNPPYLCCGFRWFRISPVGSTT
ncbi:MAG TPA: hypothetical protein VFQ85_15290 [Mycobacteriales bacterium]|jgi:hypothetical protein|nr:hypothetical protein [Mycobacteriales bacterium]